MTSVHFYIARRSRRFPHWQEAKGIGVNRFATQSAATDKAAELTYAIESRGNPRQISYTVFQRREIV